MIPNRRDFLVGSAALAAGASVSVPLFLPKYHLVRRAKRSRVAILHVEEYSQRIDQILASGLQLFRINVQGKTSGPQAQFGRLHSRQCNQYSPNIGARCSRIVQTHGR